MQVLRKKDLATRFGTYSILKETDQRDFFVANASSSLVGPMALFLQADDGKYGMVRKITVNKEQLL